MLTRIGHGSSVLSRYLRQQALATTVVALASLYAWLVVAFNPAAADIDYVSLLFEGLLAVLPALGMFQITGLRVETGRTYWPLMAGLAALTVSMTTDALDEVVDMPGLCNAILEGGFQVAGFACVLLGLRRWLMHSESLTKHLNHIATTDHLTGVANRRHFMSALEAEVRRGTRHGGRFALILIDIDHFKRVNDLHGHDAGDAVLVEIAGLLSGQMRSTDVFARYGGEEFVVLAPETAMHGAQILASKFREVLSAASLPYVGHMTASLGVAEWRPGETMAGLLKRADEALYRAKSDGRNRVVGAD